MTKDLPRQTKMEASSEGNFSVSMNTSLSAPFQEEKLGLGLYLGGGGVHVKIKMRMLVHIFGFEIWADPVSFLGVSKTGATFLGYVKLLPQEHFYTRDCNVIFRNYCVAIARKICNPATPV